jgi:hypothetical protein
MPKTENRKDSDIVGYQHPTETLSVTSKLYKTFNTESKDYYNKPKTWSSYSKFTDKESEKEINKNICPTCSYDALYVCNCKYKDCECSKGHIWFIDKNKKICIGDPHK